MLAGCCRMVLTNVSLFSCCRRFSTCRALMLPTRRPTAWWRDNQYALLYHFSTGPHFFFAFCLFILPTLWLTSSPMSCCKFCVLNTMVALQSFHHLLQHQTFSLSLAVCSPDIGLCLHCTSHLQSLGTRDTRGFNEALGDSRWLQQLPCRSRERPDNIILTPGRSGFRKLRSQTTLR